MRKLLGFLAVAAGLCLPAFAQVDNSGQSSTVPFKISATVPGVCKQGEFYYNSTAFLIYECSPVTPNTWRLPSTAGIALTGVPAAGYVPVAVSATAATWQPGFPTGAWPAYTPTTTHLSSVTSASFAILYGKTAFFNFYVTGLSDGTTPVIGLPYPMFNGQQTFSCLNHNGVAWTGSTGNAVTIQAIGVAGYNGAAPTNATTYIFSCWGTYQTQ